MTDNNEEPKVIVEVSPQTTEMVESQMVGESEDVKHETAALIEALKRRAQVEAQSAGTLTRETYLNAVRQAREAIEQNQLIERARIENAFDMVQNEATKNFESIIAEVQELGDRLQAAAQAAWDVLTAPRPKP
ncbi:hypothetical protein IQ247_06485 [Plectonema cf. radiosum LEGE 06105]|uniref:Uncharacterized protein n=1 Tax=Plectonema cf. radiosum LEGE 06105 TaxID=945769 RepID=A0A8J7F234_9CYAN|nr:hypothetical protein [Plectonema radiosum]MBE9212358.1 hypothetical protein [Plectonema cf. radiosum LEGE 06105]